MIKAERFTEEEQALANIAKALSHPARIAILRFLAQQDCCVSGDITNEIPLSRTTVSQHLTELKKLGFIQGTVEGVKINYCLNNNQLAHFRTQFDAFYTSLINNPNPSCNV